MTEYSGPIFVARYKWTIRVGAIILLAFLGFLRPSPSEFWRSSGWFFGVGVVFLYGLAVAFVLEVFIRRTWLTNKGIFQRSMFGATKFIPYSHIQELLVRPNEVLVVKYRGKRQLKVHAMEGKPEALIEFAQQFLDPNLRVVTVLT